MRGYKQADHAASCQLEVWPYPEDRSETNWSVDSSGAEDYLARLGRRTPEGVNGHQGGRSGLGVGERIPRTMILRIELPKTNMAIEGAVVDRWHKTVGDTVEYGDDLVDIVVEKVTRLQRQPVMKLLNSRRQRKPRYFSVKGGGFRLRLVAQDSGTLVDIGTPQGSSISEGSVLGTMNSPQVSADPEEAEPEAVARVVVNRVDANTEPAET